MLKKCIVKYDELGKPIELLELKEFNNPQVLSNFKAECDTNKAEYLKRQQEINDNKELEKENLLKKINSLEKEISSLKSVVSMLCGYISLEEEQVKEILKVEEE